MRHRFAISIGATVAALTLAGTAVAAGTCFGIKRSATLTGAAESPAGDPDGSGRAVIGLNVSEGLVCWSMTVKGIAAATASHIHKAPAGSTGPVVVTLGTPATGANKGCAAAARSLIRDILANPGEYYINVHNKDFPAGAVRGQLGV